MPHSLVATPASSSATSTPRADIRCRLRIVTDATVCFEEAPLAFPDLRGSAAKEERATHLGSAVCRSKVRPTGASGPASLGRWMLGSSGYPKPLGGTIRKFYVRRLSESDGSDTVRSTDIFPTCHSLSSGMTFTPSTTRHQAMKRPIRQERAGQKNRSKRKSRLMPVVIHTTRIAPPDR